MDITEIQWKGHKAKEKNNKNLRWNSMEKCKTIYLSRVSGLFCLILTKAMMRMRIRMSKNSQDMKDGDSGGFCQVSRNLSRVTSQLHPLLITQKLHPSITFHFYPNYIHYLLLKHRKNCECCPCQSLFKGHCECWKCCSQLSEI